MRLDDPNIHWETWQKPAEGSRLGCARGGRALVRRQPPNPQPHSIPKQVLAALEPGAAAVVVSHLFVTRTVVRARARVRVRAGVGVRVKP